MNKSGVRSILIPTEENKKNIIDEKNDDTNGNWREVTNSEEVFEVILEQNVNMLTRSKDGITVT